MTHVTPVILCGGSGTRLWPLSRTGFPKQFLCLTGNESLFQHAAQRLSTLGMIRRAIDRRCAIDARQIDCKQGWRPAEIVATGVRKAVWWSPSHSGWVSRRTKRRLPGLGGHELRSALKGMT